MAVTRYAYAGNGRLAGEQRNGAVNYYQPDSRGSTSRLLNQSGTVTNTFSYTANGILASHTGSSPTPMRWLGSSGMYSSGPSLSSLYPPPWISGRIWEPGGGIGFYDPGFGSGIDWPSIWIGIGNLVGNLIDCIERGDIWCGAVVVIISPPPIPNPGPGYNPPPHNQPPVLGAPIIPAPGPAPVKDPCDPIELPSFPREMAAILKLLACLAGCGIDAINPTKGLVPDVSRDLPEPVIPVDPIPEFFPEDCKDKINQAKDWIEKIACVVDCYLQFDLDRKGTGETSPWQMCTCDGGQAATQSDCIDCCESAAKGWIERAWRNQCLKACLKLA